MMLRKALRGGAWLRATRPCTVAPKRQLLLAFRGARRQQTSAALTQVHFLEDPPPELGPLSGGAASSTSDIWEELPLDDDATDAVRFGSGRQRQQLSAWVAPGSAVYANPVCSQLDKLLLKCDTLEDVLALLVTHRGVFFVHNLVTAVQVLAALAEDLSDPLSVNDLLRDPRYDLLIRDLIRFVPKLDFMAMTNIACSLWQLDHKHYVLLTRMLRPLQKIPSPDIATLLRCAQAYGWAGYWSQNDFYNRCARELAAEAQVLEPRQLVESCALFGSVSQYQRDFFMAAQQAVLDRQLLQATLHPEEAGVVAASFAAHLRTAHDALFDAMAVYVENEARNMAIPDLALCLGAFRRMALRYDAAIEAGLAASIAPLRKAWMLRRRAPGVKTAHVATLLECAAYFGMANEALTRTACEYLVDYVDEVGEASSIKVMYALSATGYTAISPSLALLLFRKIGAGTAWEAERVRVFQLWICQLLQFPWLDARLPRRCLNAGMRAWVLHRRGYGSPFPRETRAIAAELEAMGVDHRTFVPVLGTPYEVDIQIGRRKDALLVVSEASRNTLDVVGGTLLQIRHLAARGWRCIVVPKRAWVALCAADSDSGVAKRQYLQSLLNGQIDSMSTLKSAGAALPECSDGHVHEITS